MSTFHDRTKELENKRRVINFNSYYDKILREREEIIFELQELLAQGNESFTKLQEEISKLKRLYQKALAEINELTQTK